MGKETELWDDSALINAFENAITKYKTMHGGTYRGNSTREEEEPEQEQEKEIMNGTEENVQNPTQKVTEACLFSDNTGATIELPPIQNNQLGAESSATEPNKHSSSGPDVKETLEGYLQYAEYNQKLNQYYEHMEQMQKLSDELYHASSWNYQNDIVSSGSCLQWNEWCAASQSQLPTHHGCYSYCPGSGCSYHCLSASCSPIPACAMCDKCSSGSGTNAVSTACKADPVGSSLCSSDNILKAAKEFAERAISSMKLKTSMTPGVSEEKEEKATEWKEGSDTSDGGTPQNCGSETDLTVVLNAWFSAGFYTAKYLSEQSRSNSQP
ncbi:hypothetical protein MRB53_025302 [Persea americana]|uniref:Uncharacterized protein n=1 Tax=Persea americana TaxID=3435 RepID=A0ACC2LEW6_PERAE|nr:hypothetical protein MRB53_025302 [Persea americana]|eukprot:TRINITY_DN7039_c1_g1_i1.p1 TRINITY_DN7039_c1_g1~~TRINITY_DN7039_c1_g1_i1.p1  ORF type:complete len:325 (-),score=69.98 TRINITY_DN7039_c1_g1_i1:518-1492(-)